jgi:hypothetical protein
MTGPFFSHLGKVSIEAWLIEKPLKHKYNYTMHSLSEVRRTSPMATQSKFAPRNLFDFIEWNASLTRKPAYTPEKYKLSHRDESDVLRVKQYIQNILLKQKNDQLIKFPSIEGLVGFLGVKTSEVYTALKELKSLGYEYHVENPSSPIVAWDKLAQ